MTIRIFLTAACLTLLSSITQAKAAEQITADVLSNLINGNTIEGQTTIGKTFERTYNPDGTYLTDIMDKTLKGTWYIKNNDLCTQEEGKKTPVCVFVLKKGDWYFSYARRSQGASQLETWTVK